MREPPVASGPDVLAAVRTAAAALIDEQFGHLKARHVRTHWVLSKLLEYVAPRAPGEAPQGAPLILTRRDLKSLRARLVPRERHRFSPSATRRLAAFAWLLAELDRRGLIRAPRLRVPLQQARDLALQLTDEAFADEGRLGQALTPALLTALEGVASADDGPALEAAVMLGLIWEGPVLVPDAAWRLQHLRLADYDWDRGAIELPEARNATVSRRSGDGRPALRPPIRLFLRPPARLLLNFLLLSRASWGGLDLRDPDALIFSTPNGGLTASGRASLNKALARRLGALLPEPDQPWTVSRLIQAARSRTLQVFPPILVAMLSGRLRFAQVPAGDLRRLETRVPTTAPAAPRTTAPGDGPSEAVRRDIDEGDPPGDEAPLPGIAEAVYLEALEEFRTTQRLLRRPLPDLPRNQLARLARGALSRLAEGMEHLSGGVPPLLTNLRLALGWLAWQLDHPRGTRALRFRSAPQTVASRTEGLVRVLEDLVGDRDVRELDCEEWIELALEAMATVPTPNSKKAMRQRVKAFHRYLGVYEAGPRGAVARVDWGARELAVASETSEYSFPLPWEVEAARRALRHRADHDVRAVLDQATSLAYHGGLRRNEAARVSLGDVTLGLETILTIRVSKTRSGRRLVPLHLLFPRDELAGFREFVRTRLRQTGGDPTAPLLATPARPQGFRPTELARPVAQALTAVGGRRLSFHSLRHGFASLFPLRWFVAFHGPAAAGSLGALGTTSLFGRAALARFRRLFLPMGSAGHPRTTQPFLLLPVLMGHSGPELTVQVYVHTLDWLQRLYIDREISEAREPHLTARQAARACLRSIQAVYEWLEQREGHRPRNVAERERPHTIRASEVVRRQVSLLSALGRPPARRGERRRSDPSQRGQVPIGTATLVPAHDVVFT